MNRREINLRNPLGKQGRLARQYATLLVQMYNNSSQVVVPRAFKNIMEELSHQFQGSSQHDSQVFLFYLFTFFCLFILIIRFIQFFYFFFLKKELLAYLLD